MTKSKPELRLTIWLFSFTERHTRLNESDTTNKNVSPEIDQAPGTTVADIQKKWNIQLNATKAHYLSNQQSPKRKQKSSLIFDDEEINFFKTVSYLGIDVEDNLISALQCNKASGKAKHASEVLTLQSAIKKV